MSEMIITRKQFESYIAAQRTQQNASIHAAGLQGSKVVIRHIELFNGVKVQINAQYLTFGRNGHYYFQTFHNAATHVCIKLQPSTYNCYGKGARSTETHEAVRQAIVNLCTHGMNSTEVQDAMPPLQMMMGEWSLEFKYKIANLKATEAAAKPAKSLNDFASAAEYIAYLKN